MALLATGSRLGNCAQLVHAKRGKIGQASTSTRKYNQCQVWEYIGAWKAPTGDGRVEKWKQNRSLYIIYILKAWIRVSKKKARKIKVITLILCYLWVQTCISDWNERLLVCLTIESL